MLLQLDLSDFSEDFRILQAFTMCLFTSETELEINHSIASWKLPEIQCGRNHIELWVDCFAQDCVALKHWMLRLLLPMTMKVKYNVIK